MTEQSTTTTVATANFTQVSSDTASRFARSEALLAQARALIPGETSSLMKRPQMFSPGRFPAYLQGGEGATVRDVDGHSYIDFICGLGASTLGHNHPAVVDAIRDALPGGLSHSLATPIEVEAAAALVDMIPGAEMARFFKTGADATSAAVRLARHHTGRTDFINVGYNGWHDHFMWDTPGVPKHFAEHTHRMSLLSPADEPKLLSLIAERGQDFALLLLSLPYNRVVEGAYLRELREACHAQGIVFALDEVVTGFRLARGGAQQFHDVQADLVCLSKGLAAGMPLSALTGGRALMEKLAALQVSTTFGGERLSLAACLAALSVYRDTDALAEMAARGRRLREGVNRVSGAAGTALRVRGYDSIPCFMFAKDPGVQASLMTEFVGLMAERGVLLRRDVNFMSTAHTEAQVAHTIEAAAEALRWMAKSGVGLS